MLRQLSNVNHTKNFIQDNTIQIKFIRSHQNVRFSRKPNTLENEIDKDAQEPGIKVCVQLQRKLMYGGLYGSR